MRSDGLDTIDERIISCLVDDARASYAPIGGRVNLSAPAVKRRVDRLRQAGVIRGFTAVVDSSAMGWTTEAFVEVFCVDGSSAADIHNALARHPEVVDLCTVTGRPDAIARVVTANVVHLDEVLQRIRREPSVRQTQSAVVLSRLVARGHAGRRLDRHLHLQEADGVLGGRFERLAPQPR